MGRTSKKADFAWISAQGFYWEAIAVCHRLFLESPPQAHSTSASIHWMKKSGCHDEPLTREEKDLLDRWVLQGAIWPSQGSGSGPSQPRHWAFQPITAEGLLDGAPHPVDHFIGRALSKKGITPNPQASPSQLLRRLSILLTGLPPTLEELEAFEASYQRNAKKTVADWVDRKLASPHLESAGLCDVIRWAETNGSEANLYRKGAWLYDYVIRPSSRTSPMTSSSPNRWQGMFWAQGSCHRISRGRPACPHSHCGTRPVPFVSTGRSHG